MTVTGVGAYGIYRLIEAQEQKNAEQEALDKELEDPKKTEGEEEDQSTNLSKGASSGRNSGGGRASVEEEQKEDQPEEPYYTHSDY